MTPRPLPLPTRKTDDPQTPPDRLPFGPDAPWLAPLAGWSDLAFRLLCREHGAAVCCTEMISAKGLVYGGRQTEDLLATTPEDFPLVAQVFGAEPPFMGEAVRRLKDRGFRWFDVNMGCSVHKVSKTGSGAALLRDPALALAVADAVLEAAGPGHAGFKLRLGWEEKPGGTGDVFLDLGRALADRGAAWLTLHPRYAKQKFGGTPRYGAVAELVRAVPVPVLASGDLFCAEDGVRVLNDTGCAGVMYARGALADPTVFARHRALVTAGGPGSPVCGAPEQRADTPTEREALSRLIRRHAELARRYADRTALLKMRTFVPRYVRHINGARALRQRLITCTDWDTLDAILTDIPSCTDTPS